MATIQDVAKRAGVAVSTVSYAVSGVRSISDATKLKIELAMQELGYVPKTNNAFFSVRVRRVIALVFPPSALFAGLTQSGFILNASKIAEARNCNLILWFLKTDTPEEFAEKLRTVKIDALILMEVCSNDFRIPPAKMSGVPFYLIGRDEAHKGNNYTDIDFSRTIKNVLDWARDLRHTNICLVNQSLELYNSGYGPARKYHSAFYAYMQKLSAQNPTQNFRASELFCLPQPEAGRRQILRILEKDDSPTLFIVANDIVLTGVLAACAERGKRIPQDISIIGLFASDSIASVLVPAVTAFELNAKRVMDFAVQDVLTLIADPKAVLSGHLLVCELRERNSTGVCAVMPK